MTTHRIKSFIVSIVLSLGLAGCGGGGGDGTAAPPASASIGAAGGAVTETSGARVVIPAGALATATVISVARSSAGAPALPAGLTAFGPMFAFTPHGTKFATPVTITVPFDPASVPAGAAPTLYKTDATQTAWEVVPGATVSGGSMVGQVTGFSHATVGSTTVATLDLTEKSWLIEAYYSIGNGFSEAEVFAERLIDTPLLGGLIDLRFAVGRYPMTIVPPGISAEGANAAVFSNHSGRTFWTLAFAPAPDGTKAYNGLRSEITQTFYFEVAEENPTLHFVVSLSHLESIDKGGAAPSIENCPWMPANASPQVISEECDEVMSEAMNQFTLRADSLVDRGTFYGIGGDVHVNGLHHHWVPYAGGLGFDDHQLWSEADFDINPDVDGDGQQRWARLALKAPITIDVPIKHLRKGDVFSVEASAVSEAFNNIHGESFIGAYFKDPLNTTGLNLSTTGLKQIPPRHDIPTGRFDIPCATGTDPAAGSLQFSAASFHAPERNRSAPIVIERVGGTKGLVSVLVETRDGTAVAGSDYQSITTLVRFADGEGGTRLVRVPLINDDIAEPDETVNLILSRPGGCAALGTRSTAVLTILDDDRPIPVPPTFTVGGSVTGLVGSGLVLRDQVGAASVTPGNGVFTLPVALRNGATYDLRVDTQPTNPSQQCVVSGSSGTIVGANVNNIVVTCTTPPPNGSLDTGFGSGGMVSNTLTAAKAVAQQADGKLLVLGGMTLSRYNTNGSADTGFGTAGKVTIVANGGGLDAMQALALQADGKIVVAGYTATPLSIQDDMVVLRFNADGSLDTSFGGGGKVVTDFAGSTDRAYSVLVQSDGKIVAAGIATLGSGVNVDQDVALVRYLADGTLDTSFGSGGKVTSNVAGKADFAYAAALQADGKIVVAGRVATSGGANPDFGVLRYLANGSLDAGFGTGGITRVDFGGSVWDEAGDLAIQSDGKIVVGGQVAIGASYRYALIRLDAAGALDAGFGSAGLVSTDFSGKNDYGRGIALQADGRIVLVGQVSSSLNGDFGIARYLSNGTLDTGFGTAGLVKVDFFGAIDGANDVVLQGDGKIVVVGAARNGATTGIGIVRVLP